ncbi:MAG TPA: dTMP kinase [Rhodanobacteraceae bacterium]|nr:dTMP kinase [Rhodanobacteraceae bacterium]
MKPRLITLEGGEGAGKSTLLASVRARLEEHGIEVVVTREPGGTALGEAVRALVLDPEQLDICAESELLLMFAARAQLVREVIGPSMARGAWVVSDRFTDASYAYQGGGRGQPAGRIAELERWAAADLKADLTLLFDVAVAEGHERIARRKARCPANQAGVDRIEREAPAFFDRVRACYRARAAAEPDRFRVIDAGRPLEVVSADVARAIDALVARQGMQS